MAGRRCVTYVKSWPPARGIVSVHHQVLAPGPCPQTRACPAPRGQSRERRPAAERCEGRRPPRLFQPRPRRVGSERPASPPGCRVAASPRPHAARSAADAATTPAPAPRLPRRRATAPLWPPLAALSAEPGGATVAVIAARTGISMPAARQALLAHEKNGTAPRSTTESTTTRTSAAPLGRRPHDLRHAAVSLWLNSGVPATEVARRAGTASPSCSRSTPTASTARLMQPTSASPMPSAPPRQSRTPVTRATPTASRQPEVEAHRPEGGRDGQRNRSVRQSARLSRLAAWMPAAGNLHAPAIPATARGL
jgi:hypothetical protein